jgi:hypothetical protein
MDSKKLFIFILVLSLVGLFQSPLNAAKKKIDLDFRLQKVIVEPKEASTNMTVDPEKRTFSDGIISVTWNPAKTGFYFELVNKVDHSISIIWDKSAYINENGNSNKVMHAETRYMEKEGSIVPTIVHLQSKVKDVVFPTSYASPSGYEVSLFKEEEIEKIYKEKKKIDYIWRVILAIEINGELYNYHFFFDVAAKFLCPHCNRPMPPQETKCPTCTYKSKVLY